MVMTTRLN